MLSKLNPRQKEAVKYISGPLLVLAGAGSGKTSVITTKIAYLVNTCGISAKHIAAVTFTNKAAREMKERVTNLIKGKNARGLIVSTFHNLGLNIIRKERTILGFKPGFSIFDQQDALALIKDLMLKDLGDDGGLAEQFQNIISNLKNDLVTPEDAIAQAASPQEITVAQIYSRYQRTLKAYNAVDFDDLIMIPALLFQNHPSILEKWQSRVRYLLVDEYQDTNTSQYLLVKLLVGIRGALTVVGDDDQSIYSWRGARPENLDELSKDYPSLKVVKLEQNYRSAGRILKAANQLIANNPHAIEKKLWSELGYGDPIRVIKTRSEDAEAERIATEILTKHLHKKAEYRDFAVLYRGNHQAKLIELKLQAHQVPYKLSGGTSFFARNEIKDAMAYLRLLINPDDDNAFLRIINVPRREIGPSTLEGLGTYATERNVSLYSACSEMGLEQGLASPKVEKLRRFTHWLDKISENCERNDPIDAIKELFNDIDYEAWLHQHCSSPQIAEKRMANIWFLVDSLKQSIDKDEDGETGIKEAVTKLILRDLMERQEEEDESDKVQLMTLHAAKGLEFPHVYIMGMEEEFLPHRSSIEEGNIEEERRLAYVGITRAKQTLAFTLASKRKQFGEVHSSAPSRFLDELPDEDLEWEGRGDESKEVKQARGREALAGLKNLLDS